MIKMGGFFQNRFNATAAKASPRLRSRMRAGRSLLHGGKQLINLGDKALGAASDALFEPGGVAAGEALDAAAQGLNKLPLRSQLLLGGGIPAYFLAKKQTAEQIDPFLNSSIEEGRQVYASDDEFLKKKEAQREKVAVNLTELFQGIGHGLGEGAAGIGKGIETMHGGGQYAEALGDVIKHMGPGSPQGLAGLSAFDKILGQAKNMGTGMAIGGGIAGLGGLIGSALKSPVAKPIQDTGGYQANRAMNPLLDRVKYDETFADSFFKNLGSEAAKGISGLLRDVKQKAMVALQPQGGEEVVQALMVNDPILSRGDMPQMLNAYHTMSKFAPTLATDENAVRSFLREAVMAGTGPDYASISNLAKAEANIRNAMNPYPKSKD